MAKNISAKSRYPSRYEGGWVTQAQYLTECLCVLIAKREKKNLYDKFWNNSPWNKVFRRQIGLANKLLKEYDIEVILSAMRDRRCWKITSFGAKWLIEPLIQEKQREHDAIKQQQSATTPIPKASTNSKPRRPPRRRGKSLFAKLKEAD